MGDAGENDAALATRGAGGVAALDNHRSPVAPRHGAAKLSHLAQPLLHRRIKYCPISCRDLRRGEEVREMAEARTTNAWLEDAITREPLLERQLAQVRRLATSDSPVLIVGEQGSGREMFARAIHNLSGRAS